MSNNVGCNNIDIMISSKGFEKPARAGLDALGRAREIHAACVRIILQDGTMAWVDATGWVARARPTRYLLIGYVFIY